MPRRPMTPQELEDWRADRSLLGSSAQVAALAFAVLAFFFGMVSGAASAPTEHTGVPRAQMTRE